MPSPTRVLIQINLKSVSALRADETIGAKKVRFLHLVGFVTCALLFGSPTQPSLYAALGEENSGKSQTPSVGELKLVSAKRIWSDAPHNAFTSLLEFDGRMYCAFREGKEHGVKGGPGKIRIIASDDGEEWKSAALLSEVAVDVRDAHLSITPAHELMLLTGRAIIVDGVSKFHSAVQFSKDAENWSEPLTVGDPDFWLWSGTWHKGVCYSIGYNTSERNKARLYRSFDGRKFQTLVEDLGLRPYPNESTIVFDADGTAQCLLRASGPAYFGSSKPPYTDWNWIRIGEPVGGPALIHFPDGRWLAAGRRYSKEQRTALWWADPKTAGLTHALDLPSGGDTSYPGLVWKDGVLWVSYYSSHEEKTSIYLAKVSVSGRAKAHALLELEHKTNADVVRFMANDHGKVIQ